MKRTTHRSSAGKKLYAERDASGKFEDIQTYERAHGSDVKRTSKAEASAAKAKPAKKASKKASKKTASTSRTRRA